GQAQDILKPKPAKTRPKPGLSSPTRPDNTNFEGYAPGGKAVNETGCAKSVVSHFLGKSFHQIPARDDLTIAFKSHGLALEGVVGVLHDYITGGRGTNVLLVQWVEDLRHAAWVAIEKAGRQLPPDIQTTATTHLLEDEHNLTISYHGSSSQGGQARSGIHQTTHLHCKNFQGMDSMHYEPTDCNWVGNYKQSPTQALLFLESTSPSLFLWIVSWETIPALLGLHFRGQI
ncbi:hypothetical protein B0H10DRAFT_1970395, partial [Mycena sp. CBHHK59/15]